MKKILFYLVLITTFSIKAQYTITASSVPTLGDIQQYYIVNPITTAISSGTNQLWDYSGIVITPTITSDILKPYFTSSTPVPSSGTFVTLAATPGAPSYTDATIAEKATINGADAFRYYKADTSGLELLNAHVTPGGTLHKIKLLSYPFNYGSSFTHSLSNIMGNSIVTATANGTGTLVVSGYTLNNVLKVSMSHTCAELIGLYGISELIKADFFYIPTEKFPVFIVSSRLYSPPHGAPSQYSIYGRINPAFAMNVGLNEAELKDDFSIYPNPVNGQEIYLKFNCAINSGDIKIVNVIGETVQRHSIKNNAGDPELNLELDNLSPGIYFLKIKTPSFEGVKKLIVE
jgi:hypothetical protein